MPDDVNALREASLALEGIGWRLEQAVEDFGARLDLVVTGIDARLTSMTGVFALCVTLGAAAFWIVANKIEGVTNRIDSVISGSKTKSDDETRQLSEVNARLAEIGAALRRRQDWLLGRSDSDE